LADDSSFENPLETSYGSVPEKYPADTESLFDIIFRPKKNWEWLNYGLREGWAVVWHNCLEVRKIVNSQLLEADIFVGILIRYYMYFIEPHKTNLNRMAVSSISTELMAKQIQNTNHNAIVQKNGIRSIWMFTNAK
jgi:hypothetical protein